MGETAEERARRLALEQNSYVNATRILTNRMTIDAEAELTALLAEQWLNDVCREIFDEVFEEPDVSLVKKYNKGTFKF
jgi:fido (protein-threonine AMPylation protein)